MLASANIPSGWQVKFTGWPWWLVGLLAVLAVYALLRLHRLELAALPPRARRMLLWLRASALGLLILFLMEPVLTRKTTERVLPLVAVVVDQSGSMAVKDDSMAPGARLSEAIGLGLLPAGIRPLKTNAADQATADQTLVAGAKDGSAIAKALAALAPLSRYERAVTLARDTAVPALEKRARVKVLGMDTALVPLDLAKPAKLLPNRATDFEAGLASLARTWAQEYAGGVLFLTDGRQTAGADPIPVIRSLRARGALVSGILVGDPGHPPDAVVAEISGSGEVFLGENVPLSVRYRITGAADADWDMVLTREGKEIERRTVRGDGQWQYENFAFSATNAGINLYQARLELAREQSRDLLLRPSGSVTLEMWNDIGGNSVAELVDNPAFKKAPSAAGSLGRLEYANRGSSYGARIRGFLIPPQDGNYTFWIASDDSSELWLSPSDNPRDKTKVAFVSGFVPRGQWNGQPSQKSQPITLKAKRPYYFETLHKQGGGEDHLSVGWQLPDSSRERPIPASRISACDEKVLATIAQRKQEAVQSRAKEWKEASLANNSADISVVVNQDPIKVLLVDSTPRWESRYLASMFERDRRVTFTRRYHSIIIQDQGVSLLPKSQAEWDAFDMVCLGDLDANELPPQQQVFVANFVGHRGGFLVCLAGPRGMPRAFSLGTLAGVLPVRGSLSSSRDAEPVTVGLTAAGSDHPIMQILNDPGYNQKLWPLLPPLQWVADSVVAKPGATVLLAAQNSARTPIVAAQRYGAGRVFWMGTEESWRWRDRLGERVHQTFWLQVMRWGLAGRLRGRDARLQVGLDRHLVGPAEAAELKARVTTAKGEPLREPPIAKFERIGDNGDVVAGSAKQLDMLPMAETPGLWRLSVEGLDEGLWRITTSHRAGELSGLSETRDLVVRSQNAAEGLDLGGDFAGLERLAKAGGHRAATMDQAASAVNDLATRLKPRTQEHRETIRLWNSYLSMFAVMALLCTEWVLRKRQGLP
ncbi:MAG TPA: PA14 domain-containing protein [Verrucomicrobiae bacterium]